MHDHLPEELPLELCTSKDIHPLKSFLLLSREGVRTPLSLPTIHPVLPCSDSENSVRLGRKENGFWADSLGFHRRSDGSKQSTDPETSLIPHQQEPGTNVGTSSQTTLHATESKLKSSPKKRSR